MNRLQKQITELKAENERLKKRLERYEHEDVISVTVWQREDIACQLEDRGYEPSDKNIDTVISEARIADILSDCTDGNDSICWCITDVSEKLKEIDQEDDEEDIEEDEE